MSAAPISLYFDVPKGEHADLEVVARATLDWVAAIRDIAAVIAPGIEIQIEFVESAEGSVWLSNLIKAAKDGDRKALASITGGVVMFFALGPFLHVQTDLGDEFWARLGHVHKVEITEADKDDIAKTVVEAIGKTDVAERRRQLIRQVEKDDQITAVGVGLSPSPNGPDVRIPRAEFPAYGAAEPAVREAARKRTETKENIRVKIIRANLEEGESKPRWRFQDGDEKWSADIEDAEFVLALNAEQTGLPLAVGQTLVVDVAIDSRFADGVWQESNRRITHVREPHVNRRQEALDLR